MAKEAVGTSTEMGNNLRKADIFCLPFDCYNAATVLHCCSCNMEVARSRKKGLGPKAQA